MLSNKALDAGEQLAIRYDAVVHSRKGSRKHPTEQPEKTETSYFATDSNVRETSDAMPKGDLRGRALYDRLMTMRPAGLDEYEWAIKAGVNRGYFNDIKEKNTSPRNTTLAKVLAVAGKTLGDLYPTEPGAPPTLVNPPFNPIDLPRDVPILGTTAGGALELQGNGHVDRIEEMILENEPFAYARRPPAIDSNRKAYALYVTGESMEPRYRQGDLVYVDPRRAPQIGDDVIVQMVGEVSPDADPAEVKHVLIKQLVRNTAAHLELCQFNPPITFKVQKSTIHAVHRVIPLSELLS